MAAVSRATAVDAAFARPPSSVAKGSAAPPPRARLWHHLRMRVVNADAVASNPCRARARDLSRRRTAVAAAAASASPWSWPASDDGESGGSSAAATTTNDADNDNALLPLPRDILDLSLVLLVHENLRRRLGRGILPVLASSPGGDKSVAAAAAADSASSPAPAAAAPTAVDVPSALAAAEAMPAALFLFSAEQEESELLYANAAARAMLAAATVGAESAAAPRSSSAASALPPPPALSQRLPRVAEGAPCAVLRDVRWAFTPFGLEATLPRALACPVVAPSGEPVGRALLAGAWAFSRSASEREGGGAGAPPAYLGRPGWPRVAPSDLPSAASVRAAAVAVRSQADTVRALKAEAAAAAAEAAAAATQGGGGGVGDDDPYRTRGLPANKDPAVLAAVAELGRLKARLAEAEAMRAAFFGGDGEGQEGGEDEEGAAAAAAAAASVGGELMRGLLRLAEEVKDK